MTTAATRSLEMALDGLTLNSRISIGVISAPPPAPVMPTRKPMMALPRTMNGSMCMLVGVGARAEEPPWASGTIGHNPHLVNRLYHPTAQGDLTTAGLRVRRAAR